MSPLYVTAFLIFAIVGIAKIVWIWAWQSYKLLVSKIPNPGIPLPLLGHSHYFVNVLPHEMMDVVMDFVKKDTWGRKVNSNLVNSIQTLVTQNQQRRVK